jgi:hypothetical protein
MKDAFYFQHDSNARCDPKILEMISVYGMAGYGMYWVLVELLREQTDYKLDISGKYSINGMAMQMYTDNDTAKKFIGDCINEFHLFESDGNCFWSNSLKQRMKNLDEKRQKARDAANKRWENKPEEPTDNAETMHPQCDSNASREEDSKPEEIKTIEETVSGELDTNNHLDDENPVPDTKSSIPPYDEIIRLYNRICESLPNVKVLSNGRRNQIRLRWSGYGKKFGIKFFEELFERANDSAFLSGSNGKWKGCNFDWLLKEENMIKVMEGNYDK